MIKKSIALSFVLTVLFTGVVNAQSYEHYRRYGNTPKPRTQQEYKQPTPQSDYYGVVADSQYGSRGNLVANLNGRNVVVTTDTKKEPKKESKRQTPQKRNSNVAKRR